MPSVSQAQDHCVSGFVTVKVSEEKAIQLNELANQSSQSTFQIGDSEFDSVAQKNNCTAVRRLFPYNEKFENKHRKYGLHRWFVLKIDESIPVEEAVADFHEFEFVEHAEPLVMPSYSEPEELAFEEDASGSLPFGTNDPYFYLQYSLENPTIDNGGDIEVLKAWKQNTGKPEVIVAVIDGGIQSDHPDLAANMWVNEDEIPGNGIDDDGNGYIDDYHGYGFGERKGDYTPNYHGTHVGGTIGAATNNGIGVAGIAGGSRELPGVKLMSCAAFSPNGTGGFQESFVYAADNGAVISQNSWSFISPNIYLRSYEEAINYFIQEAGKDEYGNQVGPMAGGIVFFSASNDNYDLRIFPSYLDQVIAVASTDRYDRKSWFSNYGDWVDIAAPGSYILSTYTSGWYRYLSGTSMSCPHVSGTAALILSAYGKPGFTPEKVKSMLLQSADNIDEQNPNYIGDFGWGRLNAANAMKSSVNYGPSIKILNNDVEFGSIYQGESKEIDIYIGNSGLQNLSINKVVVAEGIFESIDFTTSPLLSFDRTAIKLKVATSYPKDISETIQIYSNDSKVPVKEINISGEILSAPILQFQESYDDIVLSNHTIDEFRLDFKNTGSELLKYKLSLVELNEGDNPIITLVNIAGETPSNSTDQIRMKVDARNLPRDIYSYGIRFETNEPVDNVDTLFFNVRVLGPQLVVEPLASYVEILDNNQGVLQFELKNIGEFPANYSISMGPGMSFNEIDTTSQFLKATGFEVNKGESEYIEEWANPIYGDWKITEDKPYSGKKALYGAIDSGVGLGIETPIDFPEGEIYSAEVRLNISEGTTWAVILRGSSLPELGKLLFNTRENKVQFQVYEGEIIDLDFDLITNEYFKVGVQNNEFGNQYKIFLNDELVYEFSTEDFSPELTFPKYLDGLFILALDNCDGNCEIYIDDIEIYNKRYRSIDESYLLNNLASGNLSPGSSDIIEIILEKKGSDFGQYYKDIFIDYTGATTVHSLLLSIIGIPKFETNLINAQPKVFFESDTLINIEVINTGGEDLVFTTGIKDLEDYPFEKKESRIYLEDFENSYLLEGWKEIPTLYFFKSINWSLNPGSYHRLADSKECVIGNYIGMDGGDGGGSADLISPGIKINSDNTHLKFGVSFLNLMAFGRFSVSVSTDNKQSWNELLVWDDWSDYVDCADIDISLSEYASAGDIVYLRFSAFRIDYLTSVWLDNIELTEENSVVLQSPASKVLPIGEKVSFPILVDSKGTPDGIYNSEINLSESKSGVSEIFEINTKILSPGKLMVDRDQFELDVEQGNTKEVDVNFYNSGESPVLITFDYTLPSNEELFFQEEILSENFDDLEPGDIKPRYEINANSLVTIEDYDAYSPENHLVMRATSGGANIRSATYPTVEFPEDSVSSFSMFINTDSIINNWNFSTHNHTRRIPSKILRFNNNGLVEGNEEIFSFNNDTGYKHFVLTYNKFTKENKIFYNGKLMDTEIAYRDPIFYFSFSNSEDEGNSVLAKIDNVEIINGKPKMPVVRSEIKSLHLMPGESKSLNLTVDAGRLHLGDYSKLLKVNYNSYQPETVDIGFDFEVIKRQCDIYSKTNQTMTGSVSASSFASEWQIANKAADGLPYTKWHSTFDPDQYYEVDLGKVNMLDSVRILWDYNFASSFDILVRSNESEQWSTWYSKINNTDQLTELNLTPVNARFVRLKLNSPATVFGYSIYEFELFGSCGEGDPILTTIDVSPHYYSLSPGEEILYEFTAKDQFGREYIPSNVSWSAIGNVNIDSETGLLSGLMDGEYEVILTADGMTQSVFGSVVSNDCSVSLVGSLSLNKPSVASSEEALIFVAEMANDGNLKSDWRSKSADNQWWYVELGSTYDIHEINIDWGVNFATWYELQYRDADGIWRVFYKDLNANGDNDQMDFDGSVSTDAIRLWSFTRSGPWGFNINEIEVYGICTPSSETMAAMNMSVLAYPNPPQDVVNLKLNNNKDGLWTAELYDSQFNSYGSTEIILNSDGYAELPFRFGGLYRGTYFLKLTDYDGEVTVLKILKE
nr:S8 family serine peptidase [Mangrovivirga halotolerans]